MIYIFDNLQDVREQEFVQASFCLSEERREKVNRFVFPKDRALGITAGLLLMYGLKKEYHISGPLEMSYNLYKKPFLKQYPDIYFNLSHCTGCAACGLSGKSIGIDVQEIVPYDESLAQMVMSEKELHMLHHSEKPGILFTKFWSLKESYLKCLGTGLMDNIQEIDFSQFQHTDVWNSEKEEYFEGFQHVFQCRKVKEYWLCICSQEMQKIKFCQKNEIFHKNLGSEH